VEVDGQPFETASEAAIAIYGKKTGDGGFSWPIRHRGARCGLSVVSTSKRWPSIRTKTIRMTMATMMSYEPYQSFRPRERSRLDT
jgi:hypothetical protein